MYSLFHETHVALMLKSVKKYWDEGIINKTQL